MDYTGIDGIKIGGEGSAPVDGSNFVTNADIAVPITNYCAKTVTVNNGSTLYNYVDGARIVVKPAATVYNYAANVTFSGGGSVINEGVGGEGIVDEYRSAANSAASVKITGSDGRDDIHNSGADSTILAGAGAEEIRIGVPAADKTVVIADFDSSDTSGLGNDSIYNQAARVTINGGDGADSIINAGSNITIGGGAGNDLISNSGASVTIDAGSANDTVENFAENVVINLGSDFSSIRNAASNVTINFGTSRVTNISEDGHAYKYYKSNVMLVGSNRNEMLGNNADHSTINGGGGSDVIYNNSVGTLSADFSVLDGGAGDDSINNSANNVTILGGAGADTILNTGTKNLIDGGAGDDLIQTFTGVTIRTAEGDDTISIRGGTTEITVKDFGAGYVITGLEGEISDAGENAIRVDGVVINGLQKVSVGGRFKNDTQLFATTLSGGVYRDGEVIRYAEVTDGGKTLTDNSTPVLELAGRRI